MDEHDGKCRVCGSALRRTPSGALICSTESCVTNKKTRPVCRKCNVVMEEAPDLQAGFFRCPSCGVVSGA